NEGYRRKSSREQGLAQVQARGAARRLWRNKRRHRGDGADRGSARSRKFPQLRALGSDHPPGHVASNASHLHRLRGDGMSVLVMGHCFRIRFGSPQLKAVAIALADHAEHDGTKVYPSVKVLAEKTELCERTVQYKLRELESCGLLVLVEEGG